jgi:hypothetical protein
MMSRPLLVIRRSFIILLDLMPNHSFDGSSLGPEFKE